MMVIPLVEVVLSLLLSLSSSGHHSDGVACAALETSEDGLSCC